MPSYGFMLSQIRVHRHGQGDAPLLLGTLDPPEDGGSGSKTLRTLYGLLRGVIDETLSQDDSAATRHLTIKHVDGAGQCIRFWFEVGRSGQDSTITDPDPESGAKPFHRSKRHIESLKELRRGLIVVPGNSTSGVLAIEAHGRSSGRDMLKVFLKRAFREQTELIFDLDPVADAAALAAYLENATVNTINLRRYELTPDLSDALDVSGQHAPAGSIQMMIEGKFDRRLFEKLKGNPDARQRLLVYNDIDFDELNVQLEAEGRRLTMAIVGNRAPSIINVIGTTWPDDSSFFRAVQETVQSVAPGIDVRLDATWASQSWSEEGRAFIIERPSSEEAADRGLVLGA